MNYPQVINYPSVIIKVVGHGEKKRDAELASPVSSPAPPAQISPQILVTWKNVGINSQFSREMDRRKQSAHATGTIQSHRKITTIPRRAKCISENDTTSFTHTQNDDATNNRKWSLMQTTLTFV